METETLVRGLFAAFAQVPDPRGGRGRRPAQAGRRARGPPAMLCGARSLYAIWQWGRLQEPAVVKALGFTRAQTPSVATLHRVFSRLDVAAFEAVLRTWAQANLGDGAEASAIDGKRLQGIYGEELPGVRLVAAYAPQAGLVLAQAGGRAEAYEAELRVAPAVLAALPLAGRVVTGDVLYAQRAVCQQVLNAGGEICSSSNATSRRSTWISPCCLPSRHRGSGFGLQNSAAGTGTGRRCAGCGRRRRSPGTWTGLGSARCCRSRGKSSGRGSDGGRCAMPSRVWGRTWARPACWNWCGAIERSKTGCTGCGT